MKLERIEIKNYRSITYDYGRERTFALDVGRGVNAIVGPNNAGKSNVFRALAFALDPAFKYNKQLDRPAGWTSAKPTVTLTFQVPDSGRASSENTLLKWLEQYERAVNPDLKTTGASKGIVKLRVSMEGSGEAGGVRQETFVVSGVGARKLSADDELAAKALAAFRKCFHFVMISSGQSLENLMEGRFRDILGTVLKEDLKEPYAAAEASRDNYADDLRTKLLKPLTERIDGELKDLFPEITGVSLTPEVTSLDETLARMRVEVSDRALTDLSEKGTGVRGGLIVAMLRHLASTGKRSMLFAVEEPESFLHPMAQEQLRDDLEMLADRNDVSLLVTTHSPHILSREAESKIFAIEKDKDGMTWLAAEASGDQDHAPVIGGLYPDPLYAQWLDRCHSLSAGCELLLVVEGYTDRRYIEIALAAAHRMDLLEGIKIVQAGDGYAGGIGGAVMAVAQAVTLRSTARVPVAVLLDSDAPGQAAEAQLAKIREKTKDWVPKKTLFSYRFSFVNESKDFPYEAEDLWPDHLYDSFIGSRPLGEWHDGTSQRPKPDQGCHWSLTTAGKEHFLPFLAERVVAADAERWVKLVSAIRKGAGLGEPTGPSKAAAGPLPAMSSSIDVESWRPRKAFVDALHGHLLQPLSDAGLKVHNPHARGAYIRVGLDSGCGPFAAHHLLVRVPQDRAVVALVINRNETRDENIQELAQLRLQAEDLTAKALPTPPTAWTGGEGNAVRAYAESQLKGGGYAGGDVGATAGWATDMCIGWVEILRFLAS